MVRRQIPLAEIGEFFGVDPRQLSSIHLDATKDDGAQFELRVFYIDAFGKRQVDMRGKFVMDTLRIAVVKDATAEPELHDSDGEAPLPALPDFEESQIYPAADGNLPS